eukprot:836218_1
MNVHSFFRDTPTKQRAGKRYKTFNKASCEMDPDGCRKCVQKVMLNKKGRFDIVHVLADGALTLTEVATDTKLNILNHPNHSRKYPHLKKCKPMINRDVCTNHGSTAYGRAIEKSCCDWKKEYDKTCMPRGLGTVRLMKYFCTCWD